MHKTGVLLINLGTPEALAPRAVRRYLREFLNDPRVIDLPAYLRWPLVNLVIVPLRYRKTTHAYSKIWQKEGSPLLIHTEAIARKLTQELGEHFYVDFAMRYGKPAIKNALAKFKGCQSLVVIPLFPQYSSAANGSAIEKLMHEIKKHWNMPAVKVVNDFYSHPDYVKSYAEVIRRHLAHKNPDLILFSYHGLPERHINKSECIAKCNRIHPCPQIELNNRYCYRGQCFATTQLIAKELNLSPDRYIVSFQSRLGRTPWIKPYTDVLLPELIRKGHKNIAVVCPSFVADCLETLEEVNIRAREQWLSLGGDEFTFIPCINQSPGFIKALANMVYSN